MEKSAKIYIAGHHGLVGSAIWRNLQEKGYTNLTGRSHKELDLLDGVAVKDFFDQERPEYVILAAAHVGGIMANSTYRADFIYKNLQIQQNVIGESFRHGVKKLLFLGSTCIYPRDAQQPMKEVPTSFLTPAVRPDPIRNTKPLKTACPPLSASTSRRRAGTRVCLQVRAPESSFRRTAIS